MEGRVEVKSPWLLGRPSAFWYWAVALLCLAALVAVFFVESPYGRLVPGPAHLLKSDSSSTSPRHGSVLAVSVAFVPVSWGDALLGREGLVTLSYASTPDEYDVQGIAGEASSSLVGREVDVPSGDTSWIGGSAGLALALAGLDTFWGGRLTDGRVVAATGSIDRLGTVGPVASVDLKAIAASLSGATVMVVPPGFGDQARSQAPGLEVIEAASLMDAVASLCPVDCIPAEGAGQ